MAYCIRQNKNLKFDSIEEMDDSLHGMAIEELRSLRGKGSWALTSADVQPVTVDIDMGETGPDDLILQSMSKAELQSLFQNPEEKAEKTGLSVETIRRIEKDKHKATLEEIRQNKNKN